MHDLGPEEGRRRVDEAGHPHHRRGDGGVLGRRQLQPAQVFRGERRRGRRRAGHPGKGQAVAHTLEAPWRLAVGADLALPGVTGPALPPSPLTPEYVRRLQLAASEDAEVAAALVRVNSLVDLPRTLLSPAVVERVERVPVSG